MGKKINKGRMKDEWMHLHARPAGPIPRKTQVLDEDEMEAEEFLASEEPFFFEDETVVESEEEDVHG